MKFYEIYQLLSVYLSTPVLFLEKHEHFCQKYLN